jgi:hypothetical protein
MYHSSVSAHVNYHVGNGWMENDQVRKTCDRPNRLPGTGSGRSVVMKFSISQFRHKLKNASCAAADLGTRFAPAIQHAK